ncbi:secreted endonuclease [Legionella geestiana]|uniref:Secreted endonuclease n=1 Tax=Legionella geestiana TaxID=45065 RepID=A0A0W0UAN6_9GAMM|nr:hypothetical protein [Legionella geestiana]KTD04885.1 secreted endonuclease [Legionella geestiana]QBS11291.1 hypothetical protein E4T54_00240 [Legionella geestiana]QDQ40987.1 hypothetical protein E3226_011515 [Legionella geestiana]STX54074.1 secreted endonuclease [Legionella geestiana]
MHRIVCLITMTLLLSACKGDRDNQYYAEHPAQLQAAIEGCPNHSPAGTSCEALLPLARNMQELVMELRRNPQQFGQSIQALQNTLSELASTSPAREDTVRSLNTRLAIVAWLLSPGGQS